MTEPSALRRLPREVWALGAVSLLTDTASDMVYPLLPKLLATLGAGAIALGVMEGTAELLASFLKIWAGRASDRSGVRGPFVIFGYGLAAVSRPLMSIVIAPWLVVGARALDRIGKGIRSAPRDALIGAVTPEANRGLAFGVHRAMDNLGAVFGPMVAWALLAANFSLRAVFALALFPGLVSTFLAWLAVRREPSVAPKPEPEPEPVTEPEPETAPARKLPLSSGARRLLIATAIFALSASADSFLMARLTDLALPIALLPIAWITLQAAKSLLNVPGGALADKFGARRVLLASWVVYAIAYAAFARATTWAGFWALLPLYAIHYGLGEGAEKSLMARACAPEERGTAFGAQYAVHGVALLPANVVFGVLYAKNPAIAFGASSALAAIAAIALLLLVPAEPAKTTVT